MAMFATRNALRLTANAITRTTLASTPISQVARHGALTGARRMVVPASTNISMKRFISTPATHVDWKGPEVSYNYVKRMSDQPSPDIYLIDVREPDEVAQGSIPSSVSIPLSTLNQSLRLADIDFEAKHGFTKPHKDQEIVFYCRSGKRSASASDEATRAGYKNIKNYTGSWLDWTSKEQERKTKGGDED